MSTPPTMPSTSAISDAAAAVTKTFFTGNGDFENLVHQLMTTKGENEDKAFSLLIGTLRSGFAKIEHITKVLNTVPKSSVEKRTLLLKAYVESGVDEQSCFALMDALKSDFPEAIGIIILANPKITKAEIKRHLLKHMFTLELWMTLSEHISEIEKRS